MIHSPVIRDLAKIMAAILLAVAYWSGEVVYDFSQLPHADSYCTSSGGHLELDTDGTWWCHYQDPVP